MFAPVVDVMLKQAALLAACLRSAPMGSVLLLAAALVLPLAQAGQFLAGVSRSARALGVGAERPSPALISSAETVRPLAATQDPCHGFSTTPLGLPARLVSSGRPDLSVEAVAPDETLSALVRRDLERGPPFFL